MQPNRPNERTAKLRELERRMLGDDVDIKRLWSQNQRGQYGVPVGGAPPLLDALCDYECLRLHFAPSPPYDPVDIYLERRAFDATALPSHVTPTACFDCEFYGEVSPFYTYDHATARLCYSEDTAPGFHLVVSRSFLPAPTYGHDKYSPLVSSVYRCGDSWRVFPREFNLIGWTHFTAPSAPSSVIVYPSECPA